MRKRVVDPLLPGRYGRMSAGELDREVEIFDREFIADAARPLSASDRARLKRARARRGVDRRKKRVVVSLDIGLVRRTDALAKKRGMTRAALIAEALRTVLGRTG